MLCEGLEQLRVLGQGIELETIAIHVDSQQLGSIGSEGNLQVDEGCQLFCIQTNIRGVAGSTFSTLSFCTALTNSE